MGLPDFGTFVDDLGILEKSQSVLRVQAKVLGTTSLRGAAILARDRVARHRLMTPRGSWARSSSSQVRVMVISHDSVMF